MRAPLALLAAFLAGLLVACGPEAAQPPQARHTALQGEVVRRSPDGLLIVLTDDYETVLINDRQAYRACLLHARYPQCARRR